MKFAANLSFMFPEKEFLQRYTFAKSAGFRAVESAFPFNIKLNDVLKAKTEAGIEQVLINTYVGDVTKGELGFAAVPGKENEFKTSIDTTLKYAKELNVKKIHVMAGVVKNPLKINDEVYIKNLQYCAKIFEKENIIGLIEPINKHSLPDYYLCCFKKAISVIKEVNSPNLKLLVDIFHMQQICGDLTKNLESLKGYIGHVQIAQVPHRDEPGNQGEINYKYVMECLKNIGYDDWVGLEYKPAGATTEGLKWVSDFGCTL